MTFYDSHGKAVAYLDNDGKHIFLYSGKPVAYLHDDAVYGFNGRHLGWFQNGWIRDLRGYCVFFTEDATGSGPAKPAKNARPAKSAKYAKPAKNAKYAKHAKTVNSVSWSTLSGEAFFNQ